MSVQRGTPRGKRRRGYDLPGAARRLRRSEYRVRLLISQGVITGHKDGNRWVLDADSVERVAAGEQAAA